MKKDLVDAIRDVNQVNRFFKKCEELGPEVLKLGKKKISPIWSMKKQAHEARVLEEAIDGVRLFLKRVKFN